MSMQILYDRVMEQLVKGIHIRSVLYNENGIEAFDEFIIDPRGSHSYPSGKRFSIILSNNYRYNPYIKNNKPSNCSPEEICRFCKKRNKASERLANNVCLCPCTRGAWRKRDLEILQAQERDNARFY